MNIPITQSSDEFKKGYIACLENVINIFRYRIKKDDIDLMKMALELLKIGFKAEDKGDLK